MNNVRFWIYINDGFVRLTLRPGRGGYDSRDHWDGGPTEEGHDSTWTRWSYAGGDLVEREWYNTSRDCDGRYTSAGNDVCSVLELEANPAYGDPAIPLPNWRDGESWLRDHSAEAAGY